MGQDPLLHVLECGPGLDTERLRQLVPRGLVGPQGIRLTA